MCVSACMRITRLVLIVARLCVAATADLLSPFFYSLSGWRTNAQQRVEFPQREVLALTASPSHNKALGKDLIFFKRRLSLDFHFKVWNNLCVKEKWGKSMRINMNVSTSIIILDV
jgi:hypothetical protein